MEMDDLLILWELNLFVGILLMRNGSDCLTLYLLEITRNNLCIYIYRERERVNCLQMYVHKIHMYILYTDVFTNVAYIPMSPMNNLEIRILRNVTVLTTAGLLLYIFQIWNEFRLRAAFFEKKCDKKEWKKNLWNAWGGCDSRGHFLAYPLSVCMFPLVACHSSLLRCFLSVFSVKQTTYAMTVSKAILFCCTRLGGLKRHLIWMFIWMPCDCSVCAVHLESCPMTEAPSNDQHFNSIPCPFGLKAPDVFAKISWSWIDGETSGEKVFNTSDLFMKHWFTQIMLIMWSFFVKHQWFRGEIKVVQLQWTNQVNHISRQAMITSAHPPNMTFVYTFL